MLAFMTVLRSHNGLGCYGVRCRTMKWLFLLVLASWKQILCKLLGWKCDNSLVFCFIQFMVKNCNYFITIKKVTSVLGFHLFQLFFFPFLFSGQFHEFKSNLPVISGSWGWFSCVFVSIYSFPCYVHLSNILLTWGMEAILKCHCCIAVLACPFSKNLTSLLLNFW